MNSLFKQDILDVNIDVRGETSNYTVRVSFNGILDELHNFLNGQNSAIVRARDISKALTRAFNNNHVYVRCSCPDWKYRHGYFATKNGFIVGDPENIPSNITNPNDTKGGVCKHVSLALSDASWLVKVSSVIYNYINYMEQQQPKLYKDFIYPAVYQKAYDEDEEGTQLSMWDDDNLGDMSDTERIDQANASARKKGRFTAGNKYRFTKQKSDDNIEGQMTFDEIPNEERI